MQESSDLALDFAMVCRAKRLTFKQIGQRMQPPVTRTTISRWSNGERGLTEENAAQLAEIIGEPVSAIKEYIAVGTARRVREASKPSPDPGTARRRHSDPAEARAVIAS